jgi:hypothetical protein
MRGPMKFQGLEARLRELEASQGYETLDDGSKFRFQHSGIRLYCEMVRHGRDTGREAVLSDFSEDEQRELLAYARWSPDPALHGQISIITCQMAREILARCSTSDPSLS